MTASSFPLQRPTAWAEIRSFGKWSLVLGIVLLAAGIGVGVLTLVSERSEHGALFAVMTGSGPVAWGFVAIGMAFPARSQSPTLVNAVAVTPVPELLPDDWVHLFRRRRTSRILTLGLFGLGFFLIMLAGGCVYLVAVGAEDPALLLLLILPLAAGIGWVVFSAREAISQRRLSAFGRPPTGLTLGRSGLTLLDPVVTHFIPWERLQSVTATLARTRGGKSPLYPIIVLTFRADDGQAVESVTLQMIQQVVAPHVVFSALATAFERREFREQLGTTQAQAVLDAWVADSPQTEPVTRSTNFSRP